MQMTAFTGQYGRYVLNNLIDSLDQPYYEPESAQLRADAALERPGRIARNRYRRTGSSSSARASSIRRASTGSRRRWPTGHPATSGSTTIDVYLVQALLYLQCDDPRIKARVLKYLRCEDLTPHDRRLLGGIVPCTYPDAPHWVIQRLGQVIWAVERVPLVLCVDQLEDVFDLDEAAVKFRKAMATLCDLVSRLPSAIVVISCLENFYDELKKLLTRPIKDRVENDPRPIGLQTPCDRDEVVSLIGRRLKLLFESSGVPRTRGRADVPAARRAGAQAGRAAPRDVLLECQLYRERCVEEGKMADYPFEGGATTQEPRSSRPSSRSTRSSRPGMTIRQSHSEVVPVDEAELAAILAAAIRGVLGRAGDRARVRGRDGRTVRAGRGPCRR